MLKGYFDESGIHGGSPVCIVAGFVADSKTCGKLSWDWQGLLAKYQLKHFHTKEYANRTGPFKEAHRGWGESLSSPRGLVWDDDLRQAFEIDAIAVINGAESVFGKLMVIGAAVKCSDFFALTLDQRRWLTGGSTTSTGKWRGQGVPKKPYFLAFQQAVLDAVKFTQDTDTAGRHLGTGEVVDFIFDQQKEYEYSAKAIFNAMKIAKFSVKDRIGDIVFKSKERAVPLQIADFVAYESYSYLKNRIVRGKNEVRAHISQRLLLRGRRTVFIDGTQLKNLLAKCPQVPNAQFMLPDPVDVRVAMGLRGPGIVPGDNSWWL